LESAYGNGLLHPLPVMTLAAGIGGGLALALLLIFFKGIYYNYVFSKEDIKERSNRFTNYWCSRKKVKKPKTNI